MATYRENPPSPRSLIQQTPTLPLSFALSDAILGAFSFATVSAASFSAVTAPLPPASISSNSDDVPAPRGRYNTRSTSRMADKENCQRNGRENDANRHCRHVMPEATSRSLAHVTSNGRSLRAIRRSMNTGDSGFPSSSSGAPSSGSGAPSSNSGWASGWASSSASGAPSLASGAPSSGSVAVSDSMSPPLLASTPSKSTNPNNLLRACLQTNAQRTGAGMCSEFPRAVGYDFTHTRSSFVTSFYANLTSSPDSQRDPSTDDSVIVLDDTRESDVDPPEVFRFTGRDLQGDQNESKNDSVLIISPPNNDETDENGAELLEASLNIDDSIRVTSHKVKRVCPITKLPFQQPVSNLCGHTYEKSAISAMYFARKVRGKLCPCPVAGCDKKVWLLDLKRV